MSEYITKSLKRLESSKDTLSALVEIIESLLKNFEEGKISSHELVTTTKACLEGVRNK